MGGDHDEAMALAPEDVKDDLRAELFVLQSALKALQYPGLDELDKFLSLTYSESADSQIPKLRKQIDRMRRVKALLSEGTTSSSPAPSAHANHKMSRPELSPAPSAVASNFAFRVCVSMRKSTITKCTRIANFLYDNLLKTGNTNLCILPTAWLDSLEYPADISTSDVKSYLKQGYLSAAELLDAARTNNPALIEIGKNKVIDVDAWKRTTGGADAFREWAINHLKKEGKCRVDQQDLKAAWNALPDEVRSKHNKFDYMFKPQGTGGGPGLTMEHLYSMLEKTCQRKHPNRRSRSRRQGRSPSASCRSPSSSLSSGSDSDAISEEGASDDLSWGRDPGRRRRTPGRRKRPCRSGDGGGGTGRGEGGGAGAGAGGGEGGDGGGGPGGGPSFVPPPRLRARRGEEGGAAFTPSQPRRRGGGAGGGEDGSGAGGGAVRWGDGGVAVEGEGGGAGGEACGGADGDGGGGQDVGQRFVAPPRARLVPSGVWSTTSNSLESSSGKNVNRLAGTSQ